jgi:hypothetical protein
MLCAIGAGEYRPSAFAILIICSNLAVLIIIFEATAKQALGILIPQQHKCADVTCHNSFISHYAFIFERKLEQCLD